MFIDLTLLQATQGRGKGAAPSALSPLSPSPLLASLLPPPLRAVTVPTAAPMAIVTTNTTVPNMISLV
eukprot:CAMPEP_0181040774 /NCGR_PEP_ID=MMETSP1070-20121207/11233_1 /TAXON_ID=265543 /ORGANISM="Minutocellus polymorphus, Strain NH13" /LENGTH=67 /DNA_ID=CAMNT_0023118817 /DNA_START=50 /DNA_END=253 /DNA_ORIENTATION=-